MMATNLLIWFFWHPADCSRLRNFDHRNVLNTGKFSLSYADKNGTKWIFSNSNSYCAIASGNYPVPATPSQISQFSAYAKRTKINKFVAIRSLIPNCFLNYSKSIRRRNKPKTVLETRAKAL